MKSLIENLYRSRSSRGLYNKIDAILADSFAQSSRSSWTIQRESIQRWETPMNIVNRMACWNVLGNPSHGIVFLCSSNDSLVVRIIWCLPQQWLKHTYRSTSCSAFSLRKMPCPIRSTRTVLVGRRVTLPPPHSPCVASQVFNHSRDCCSVSLEDVFPSIVLSLWSPFGGESCTVRD
jgi:hypothetical protein